MSVKEIVEKRLYCDVCGTWIPGKVARVVQINGRDYDLDDDCEANVLEILRFLKLEVGLDVEYSVRGLVVRIGDEP
ncbi:MAG: hypothetical protein EHM35_00575 [Planctomycetaceae bacterium]|nr:MAG: hypothetical protein EHM35_00575 [Planctomycetaceae bacterium]